MTAHAPRNPTEIRDALQNAAQDAYTSHATCAQSTRWAVIQGMEDAWREQPVKVRAANRRTVLGYVFGQTSSKQLSDAHIIALEAHLADFDAWSELRLLLRAALIDAGQAELDLAQGERVSADGGGAAGSGR